MQVVAFSGGKDSTAMALRLAELGEEFSLLFTPTGNELPGLVAHVNDIVGRIDRPLVTPDNRPLSFWIDEFNALPNWRQRWCTRLIKIEPCIAYLRSQDADVTLCVGLRADEPERTGLYGEHAAYRYPLREWGWGVTQVIGYNLSQGVVVPRRTDCAVCPYQKLGEWYDLWRDYPEEYARGERWEVEVGHTFRSPARDSWPASLADLRLEFERGRVPRGVQNQGDLFDDAPVACRVCSL